MRDQAIWSIGVGRWQGVAVRVHMFFLLFAALTLYLSWIDAQRPISPGNEWAGWVCLVVLFVSVVVHELGHVIVAQKLGSPIDEVIIGPVGGLGTMPQNLEPQAEMVMVVAGPLANLGMCLMSALCLAIQGEADLQGLLSPVSPDGIMSGTLTLVVMKLTFWINWLLAVLNLIPAFPFDGGRMVRAALVLTQVSSDYQRSSAIVTRVAKLTAVAFVIAAWMVQPEASPDAFVQARFAFLLLAIFIYFSARKEELFAQSQQGDDGLLGYDFSEGYTSLERSGPKLTTKPLPGPLVRWWQRRKELREQRQRDLEVLEDGLVDEILSRVHQSGLQSLSTEDRSILDRVSARYRSRPSGRT